MTVVRKNILNDAAVRDQFIQAIKLLKQENSGRTTTNLGISGPAQAVSNI